MGSKEPFSKFRLAGIVSVISICGVLAIEIVGNVVGEYISDELKSWQSPALTATTESASDPSEPANAVTLPVTHPSEQPTSETVVRASVGDPQSVETTATSNAGAPAPQPDPAPAQGAAPAHAPAPVQEAAVPEPEQDLIVPGPGNRAANRAAMKKRINKWRAQRWRRSQNRWDGPRYPRP